MTRRTHPIARATFALLTASALGSGGCLVPKGKFQKAQADSKSCYEALEKENERKNELASALSQLEEAMKNLAEERERLAAEKGELEGNLGDLEADVASKLAQISSLSQEKQRLEKEREKLKEKTETYDQLVDSLKQEMQDKLIQVRQQGQRLTVNVSDRILFDSGSTEIKPKGEEALKKIAEVLAKVSDRRIDVEGHTDNVPITGDLAETFPTNWELSVARATNVVRLLETNGVNPKRMAAVGKSSHRPRARNTSKRGRQLNRRIEIVLTPWDGQ